MPQRQDWLCEISARRGRELSHPPLWPSNHYFSKMLLS